MTASKESKEDEILFTKSVLVHGNFQEALHKDREITYLVSETNVVPETEMMKDISDFGPIKRVQCFLGDVAEYSVQRALRSFGLGETSLIRSNDETEDNPGRIFKVTLEHVKEEEPEWKMSGADKMQLAVDCKVRSDDHVGAARWERAAWLYRKVIRLICDARKEVISICDEDTRRKYDEILSASPNLEGAAYSNLALCELKLHNYKKAHLALRSFELAEIDFRKCLDEDPGNVVANISLRKAISKVMEERKAEKLLCTRVLDGMKADADRLREEEEKNATYVLENVGQWDNRMADGIICIEDEVNAFEDHPNSNFTAYKSTKIKHYADSDSD